MRLMLKIVLLSIPFILFNGIPETSPAETGPQYGPWESVGSYSSPSRYRQNNRAQYRKPRGKPRRNRSPRPAIVDTARQQRTPSQTQSAASQGRNRSASGTPSSTPQQYIQSDMTNANRPGYEYRPAWRDLSNAVHPGRWVRSDDSSRSSSTPRASQSSTTRPSVPTGRLDAIGGTRLVYPNPFPGQSVEPQVPDNQTVMRPLAMPSSSTHPNVSGRNLIDASTQALFTPSIMPSRDGSGQPGDGGMTPATGQESPWAEAPIDILPPPPGRSFRDRLHDAARNPESVREEMEMTAMAGAAGTIAGPLAGKISGTGAALPGAITRMATANNLPEFTDEIFRLALPYVDPTGGIIPGGLTILRYGENQIRLEEQANGKPKAESGTMVPMQTPRTK